MLIVVEPWGAASIILVLEVGLLQIQLIQVLEGVDVGDNRILLAVVKHKLQHMGPGQQIAIRLHTS